MIRKLSFFPLTIALILAGVSVSLAEVQTITSTGYGLSTENSLDAAIDCNDSAEDEANCQCTGLGGTLSPGNYSYDWDSTFSVECSGTCPCEGINSSTGEPLPDYEGSFTRTSTVSPDDAEGKCKDLIEADGEFWCGSIGKGELGDCDVSYSNHDNEWAVECEASFDCDVSDSSSSSSGE